MQFSDDGERWQTVQSVTDGRGGPDPLRLPDAETRFVRLALTDGPADHYSLAEVEIRPDGRKGIRLPFGTYLAEIFPAINPYRWRSRWLQWGRKC